MSELVRYGISGVHYAPYEIVEGKPVFETPKPLIGAETFTKEPSGEASIKYADNSEFFVLENERGFTGTLGLSALSDEFKQDALGEIKDSNGVMVQKVGTNRKKMALIYQMETDGLPIRGVLYNVRFSKPSQEAATTTDTTEFATNEVPFTASPLKLKEPSVVDGEYDSGIYVGLQTTQSVDNDVFNAWNTKVYITSDAQPEGA